MNSLHQTHRRESHLAALQLWFWGGWSQSALARLFRVSDRSVRTWLRRAVRYDDPRSAAIRDYSRELGRPLAN